MNKNLQYELVKHCNNCRVPDLKKNMFVLALNNLWRDVFQYQAQPLRKQSKCQLCEKCGKGDWVCTRYPDCKDDEKTPVRLPHLKACSKCPHHPDYKAEPKYDDVKRALEDCEPLW